ncbi:MAG: tetratricopeptide repeat protein, partial [Flavobacteriaceae bacterium]|nr:tetratricopeptide repeat protein [Flavobacteriaceae bacterium]
VITIILIVCTPLLGQQINLEGQISIHNSKYETGAIQYVQDAYISAPFTKPANSDTKGKFQLDFVGLEPGTSIELLAEKSGLEVVNKYALQDVVINRKLPVRIFLIDKGKLAEAQTELYNISKKALHKRRDDMIARLRKNNEDTKRALKELETDFGIKLQDSYQAEKELTNKISELEKRLPEFSQNLAKQNLDFASEMYVKAYELYKAGDIKQAIKILDTASLNESYEKAQGDVRKGEKLLTAGNDLIEKGMEQMVQIADSYELKAKSHYLLFQYEQAIEVYEKLVQIYLANDLSKKKLLTVYDDLALAYQDNENLDKSMIYHKKLVALAEKILEPTSLELAQYYNNIALNHNLLDEMEVAFAFQNKAIAIQEAAKDSLDNGLATSYNNIALMYGDMDEIEKSLEYMNKAIELQSKLYGPESIELALNYSNLSNIYSDFNDYDNLVKYSEKALAIRKQHLDSLHPDIAESYDNISDIYQEFGEYEKALDLLVKATRIREAVFEPDHPIMAMTYNALARSYADAGKFEEALKYQEKEIRLTKSNFPNEPTKLIQSYYTLGIIHRGLKEHQKALDYHFKALELKKTIHDADDGEMGNSYYRIAECYRDLKNYETTLEYLDQAIAIDIDIHGKSHRYIAEDYLLYAEVLLQTGNYTKTGSYRNKAERIIKKLDEEIRDDLEPRLLELDKSIESFKSKN